MQEVHSLLMMQSYNSIAAVIYTGYVLLKWVATGNAPFQMVWCTESALLLAGSCLCHLMAQMTMFHIN